MYVKLVNAGTAAAPVQLDIVGASLRPDGTAITLAGDPQDTNSIDAPDRVVPKTSQLTGVKSGFTYTVPPNGIVVLELGTRESPQPLRPQVIADQRER
jgi:alpha-N-arabinofuranosidase